MEGMGRESVSSNQPNLHQDDLKPPDRGAATSNLFQRIIRFLLKKEEPPVSDLKFSQHDVTQISNHVKKQLHKISQITPGEKDFTKRVAAKLCKINPEECRSIFQDKYQKLQKELEDKKSNQYRITTFIKNAWSTDKAWNDLKEIIKGDLSSKDTVSKIVHILQEYEKKLDPKSNNSELQKEFEQLHRQAVDFVKTYSQEMKFSLVDSPAFQWICGDNNQLSDQDKGILLRLHMKARDNNQNRRIKQKLNEGTDINQALMQDHHAKYNEDKNSTTLLTRLQQQKPLEKKEALQLFSPYDSKEVEQLCNPSIVVEEFRVVGKTPYMDKTAITSKKSLEKYKEMNRELKNLPQGENTQALHGQLKIVRLQREMMQTEMEAKSTIPENWENILSNLDAMEAEIGIQLWKNHPKQPGAQQALDDNQHLWFPPIAVTMTGETSIKIAFSPDQQQPLEMAGTKVKGFINQLHQLSQSEGKSEEWKLNGQLKLVRLQREMMQTAMEAKIEQDPTSTIPENWENILSNLDAMEAEIGIQLWKNHPKQPGAQQALDDNQHLWFPPIAVTMTGETSIKIAFSPDQQQPLEMAGTKVETFVNQLHQLSQEGDWQKKYALKEQLNSQFKQLILQAMKESPLEEDKQYEKIYNALINYEHTPNGFEQNSNQLGKEIMEVHRQRMLQKIERQLKEKGDLPPSLFDWKSIPWGSGDLFKIKDNLKEGLRKLVSELNDTVKMGSTFANTTQEIFGQLRAIETRLKQWFREEDPSFVNDVGKEMEICFKRLSAEGLWARSVDDENVAVAGSKNAKLPVKFEHLTEGQKKAMVRIESIKQCLDIAEPVIISAQTLADCCSANGLRKLGCRVMGKLLQDTASQKLGGGAKRAFAMADCIKESGVVHGMAQFQAKETMTHLLTTIFKKAPDKKSSFMNMMQAFQDYCRKNLGNIMKMAICLGASVVATCPPLGVSLIAFGLALFIYDCCQKNRSVNKLIEQASKYLSDDKNVERAKNSLRSAKHIHRLADREYIRQLKLSNEDEKKIREDEDFQKWFAEENALLKENARGLKELFEKQIQMKKPEKPHEIFSWYDQESHRQTQFQIYGCSVEELDKLKESNGDDKVFEQKILDLLTQRHEKDAMGMWYMREKIAQGDKAWLSDYQKTVSNLREKIVEQVHERMQTNQKRAIEEFANKHKGLSPEKSEKQLKKAENKLQKELGKQNESLNTLQWAANLA